MVYLSKSKYCELWQCPKIAWMKKYKPKELTLDKSVLSRMEAGNEVGDLAMGLFGDYVEVTAYKNDKLDLSKMIETTKAEMQKGTPVCSDPKKLDLKGLSHKRIFCLYDSPFSKQLFTMYYSLFKFYCTSLKTSTQNQALSYLRTWFCVLCPNKLF